MISHRVSDSDHALVLDHVDVLLNCIYELSQYALALQSCPCKAASLLCERSDHADAVSVHRAVLADLRREWQVVLKMESSEAWSSLLRSLCPQFRWQIVREIFSALEQVDFQRDPKVLKLLTCWFGGTAFSANIEDIFATLSDSIKRSSKADAGSLCNAQAVCMRGVQQKCSGERAPEPVVLEAADWEGAEVRGLKATAWRPENCSHSSLS